MLIDILKIHPLRHIVEVQVDIFDAIRIHLLHSQLVGSDDIMFFRFVFIHQIDRNDSLILLDQSVEVLL